MRNKQRAMRFERYIVNELCDYQYKYIIEQKHDDHIFALCNSIIIARIFMVIACIISPLIIRPEANYRK